jgi:RHS repeat-associated protein
MYSPALGRFLSRDPVLENGNRHLVYDNNWFGQRLSVMRDDYGYAYSNPINFIDPSGLQGECTGGSASACQRQRCGPPNVAVTPDERRAQEDCRADCRRDCAPARPPRPPRRRGGGGGPGGGMLIGGIGAAITTDVYTPDPSDLCPPKWVIYGIIGAIAGGYWWYKMGCTFADCDAGTPCGESGTRTCHWETTLKGALICGCFPG